MDVRDDPQPHTASVLPASTQRTAPTTPALGELRSLRVMDGRVELSESTWRQPWPMSIGPGRLPVLRRVVDRIQALGDRRVRVGIDGRTAAGKTTLGHELASLLADAGRVVLRASLDDFKRPWAERHRYDRVSGEGYYRNAFDLDAIRELLLEPADPTGTGRVALCSIDPITQVDYSGTRVAMPSDGVLVVDGVFALRPELNGHWDLRIWLDIDPEVSVHRGTTRDGGRDGPARAEALHRERYAPAERLYVAEADPVSRADVIIDNTCHSNPVLLRG
jgi:uridine kinase